MTILLATHNREKGKELAAVLAGDERVEVITLGDLDVEVPEPIEDGERLEENAWIKAKEIHDATGLPVIADDTGLEVTALDGAPGVYSARYAGEEASYDDNCTKLLAALEQHDDRSARFRTVLCYVDGMRVLFAEGEATGVILTERSGGGGFGYDPIFRPEGEEKSFAEMSPEEKNRISHRGRAVRAFRDLLENHLPEENV